MCKEEFNLHDYKIDFYYQPGITLEDNELTKLKLDLDTVNNKQKQPIKFGIFSDSANFKELSKNIILSIFYYFKYFLLFQV